MLVLNRYEGQAVRLGGNVEIHVLEVRGGQVRLGFTAPRDIPVHRAEVAEVIEAQGQRLPDIAPSTKGQAL